MFSGEPLLGIVLIRPLGDDGEPVNVAWTHFPAVCIAAVQLKS
jgi:hypothetical protein